MKSKRIISIICAAIAASACGLMLCGCGGISPNARGENGGAQITAWEVPDKYRAQRTDGAGEVVELGYTAHDYALESGNTEQKTLNVYLPYGYDEQKQYNIVYLIHGTDPQTVDHKNTWLYTVGVKNVLDNMIFYGDIEPVIVVTPVSYSYGLYGDDVMSSITEMTDVKKNSNDNFGRELRFDIIPAVEGKFSTYAENTDGDGLIASRDHRAMAGLSNGCRITYLAGMTENFDIISWFGCYSASADSDLIIEALNNERNKDFKLNYMFNADGIYDFAYNAHRKMVDALMKDSKFTSENTEYVRVEFGYHSARSWRVGFYNSMLRFFK